MYYLAFVFTDAGGYGFTCPDVEGFTAHAETADFAEAVSEARTVLTAHVAAMVDAGAVLPAARAIEDLRADPALADDFAEAVTTVMLPVVMPSGRTIRFNVSVDEAVLGMIDRASKERGLTRSAFLAEAARQMAMA